MSRLCGVRAARLEGLRLVAVEERIEAELALGRHAGLVEELGVLVGEHPHRERLRGLLMVALYRSGRQAEALEAYREARASLAELGLEPGGELRRLERQILGQDPGLELRRDRLVAAEGLVFPGPLAPLPSFPFVGRERELERLRMLLGRAEAGEGGVVLLGGEAGAGKTRLLRELAGEALGRGMLVLYGASDADVTTPYEPVREWIKFLIRVCDPAGLAECLTDGGDRLSRLVPELERLTDTPTPPRDDNGADPFVLQSAAAELLRRLSRLQPLLLLVDDIHWSDGETLHLLRRLARSAPEGRTLVVAAYRDRGKKSFRRSQTPLATCRGSRGSHGFRVGNLTRDEVSVFIRASTEAEATPELVTSIRELTDGTPLLLCELWRDLRESGGAEAPDSASLARAVAELRGPERIRDIVKQRLSRLAPDATAAVSSRRSPGLGSSSPCSRRPVGSTTKRS